MNNTLIELVIEEAKALKANATKIELSSLNLENLIIDSPEQCVYGLMTGSCYSDRADELITKCCSRVYEAIYENEKSIIEDSPLNGKPSGKRVYNDEDRVKYWSPIEVFILQKYNDENIKRLICYLSGETDMLEFINN